MLSVRDLHVQFTTARGLLRAVDGVSFDIAPKEVLAIVGESGSGKTVTALSVLGLLPANASVSGEILLHGRDVRSLGEPARRALRGNRVAMVFQDALAALNPLHKVGRQVAEAIRVHQPKLHRAAVRTRVVDLLSLVGIPDPPARLGDYPHQLSGGMRQRVMIAIAMANDPDLLIADEPTTALDVTTQAQVLDVLRRVREKTGAAMLLISHDLGVVAGAAQRVIVMYAGRVVEVAAARDLFHHAGHPYARGLLDSLPGVDQEQRRLRRIPGQPPSMIDLPAGCRFHPRCAWARLPDPCADVDPGLLSIGPGHEAACHFASEVTTGAPPPGTGR